MAVWIGRRIQEGWVIRILLIIAVVVTVIQVIQVQRSSKTSGPLPEEVRHLERIPTFVACDSTPKEGSTSERVDDSVITTKVKSQLAQDDFLKSFQIGVETFKGNVQLSGFVDSQKAVGKAGEINGSVKGVKSVKNSLVVK